MLPACIAQFLGLAVGVAASSAASADAGTNARPSSAPHAYLQLIVMFPPYGVCGMRARAPRESAFRRKKLYTREGKSKSAVGSARRPAPHSCSESEQSASLLLRKHV